MANKLGNVPPTANDAEMSWNDATNLLGRACDAFAEIASRRPNLLHVSLLARILKEAHEAAEAWANPAWSGALDAFDAAARLMSFARRGRPAGGVPNVDVRRADGATISDDDLDFVDRCIRLAFAFVRDADDILEGRRPRGVIERIQRAEGGNTSRRKRLSFLRAVAVASRYEATNPLAHRMMVDLMQWADVGASKRITPELVRKCVQAWSKTAGQRGKWKALAECCVELDLGETTADELKREWSAAQAGKSRLSSKID